MTNTEFGTGVKKGVESSSGRRWRWKRLGDLWKMVFLNRSHTISGNWILTGLLLHYRQRHYSKFCAGFFRMGMRESGSGGGVQRRRKEGRGGGFFLAWEDFGRMFDNLFPACAFFFQVEISSRALIQVLWPDQSTVAQRAEMTVAECSLTR